MYTVTPMETNFTHVELQLSSHQPLPASLKIKITRAGGTFSDLRRRTDTRFVNLPVTSASLIDLLVQQAKARPITMIARGIEGFASHSVPAWVSVYRHTGGTAGATQGLRDFFTRNTSKLLAETPQAKADDAAELDRVTKAYVLIHRTLCTVGHRDVPAFMEAATQSNLYPDRLADRRAKLEVIRGLLSKGLETFVPGYIWFDARTAIEISCLLPQTNLTPNPLFA